MKYRILIGDSGTYDEMFIVQDNYSNSDDVKDIKSR